MRATSKPIGRPIRRDGWTPLRRRRFTESLASGSDVRRACADVGLSREGAYKLRRRDPVFAREWQTALLAARQAAAEAFLAGLPENLRRTMSELSGLGELRNAEMRPRTVSELSGTCELRPAAKSAGNAVRAVSAL